MREYNLDRISEALDMLDVDGFNMNFTRWPPFIRPEADTAVMVDFIKEARRRIEDAARRKGRRLWLSADLVDGYYANLTLTEQRVDLEAWLKTGVLDYICIEQTRHPAVPYAPDHDMQHYIEMGKRLGVPIYPRQDQLMPDMEKPCAMTSVRPWVLDDDGTKADLQEPEPVIHPQCGPLHYQVQMERLYRMGAEKIELSNRWQSRLTNRRLGHRAETQARIRKGEVFGVRYGQPISWQTP